jgi:hypothetical protein
LMKVDMESPAPILGRRQGAVPAASGKWLRGFGK